MLVFLVFLKWRAISLIGTSGGFKLALHACNSHFPGSHSQLKEVLTLKIPWCNESIELA